MQREINVKRNQMEEVGKAADPVREHCGLEGPLWRKSKK